MQISLMGCPMSKKIAIVYFLIFLTIFTLYIITMLDKFIYPQILIRAEQILKKDAIESIRNITLSESSDLKNIHKYIFVDRKYDGTITSIQSNGAKLNAIAFNIAKLSEEEFNSIRKRGISVPMGYAINNILFYNLGPKIKVKIDDISYIETNYRSEFSKSGINQTIYKIYITFNSNVRLILSNEYKDVSIKTEIPIWETIIVGDAPEQFIDLNLENSGAKITMENMESEW